MCHWLESETPDSIDIHSKEPPATNNLLNKWHIYIDFLVTVFLGRFFHLCSAMLESAGVEDFSSELITDNSIFTIPGVYFLEGTAMNIC